MRILIVSLLLLGGCGAVDALQNARTPDEAIYLLRKSEGEERVNPYERAPEYTAVYCTVDGVQYRATVTACEQDGGEATPIR